MNKEDQNYQEEEEQGQQPQYQYPQYQPNRKRRQLMDLFRSNKRLSSGGAGKLLKFGKFAKIIPPQVLLPALGIILLFVVIFFIIFLVFITGGNKYPPQVPPIGYTPPEPDTGEVIIPRLTFTKTSAGSDGIPDDEVSNDEDIIYTLTATYDVRYFPSYASNAIYDILPPETETEYRNKSLPDCSLGTTPCCDYRNERGVPPAVPPPVLFPYIECGPLPPPPPCSPEALAAGEDICFIATLSFTVTVRPMEDDIYVYNNAVLAPINTTPSVLGISTSKLTETSGQGEIITADQPQEFNKENLYSLLLTLDPKNADFWFYKIIPCESGFDPEFKNKSPLGHETLGLFQFLNQSGDPNVKLPWQDQVKAAVNYNKTTNNTFSYWECAQ